MVAVVVLVHGDVGGLDLHRGRGGCPRDDRVVVVLGGLVGLVLLEVDGVRLRVGVQDGVVAVDLDALGQRQRQHALPSVAQRVDVLHRPDLHVDSLARHLLGHDVHRRVDLRCQLERDFLHGLHARAPLRLVFRRGLDDLVDEERVLHDALDGAHKVVERGLVHLRHRLLERNKRFLRQLLGVQLLRRRDPRAVLGVGLEQLGEVLLKDLVQGELPAAERLQPRPA